MPTTITSPHQRDRLQKRARDKENMPPPKSAFGLSSSSSSRHAYANSEEDDDDMDADDSYRRRATSKKLASVSTKQVSSKPGSRAQGSSAGRSKRDHDYEDEELRPVKRAHHGAASSSHRPHSSSSRRGRDADDDDDNGSVTGDAEARREEEEGDLATGELTDELLFERKAYDQWLDKKLAKLASKREQMLQEKLERIRSERDEVQSQYDELRQLRTTAPERALDEFKKTAEARFRHDKDLVSSLKSKVEAAEKRAREALEGAGGGGSNAAGGGADRSISILNASLRESVQPSSPDRRLEELEKKHKKELHDATRAQRRLEEEVRNYKLQLEQEIAQSKALLAAASGAPASTGARNGKSTTGAGETHSTAAAASLAAMEDEKAIRKLYEDLTGLVITGVDKLETDSRYRRFKAIFAQEGFYSLLMDLEESSSSVTDESGKKSLRHDIVFVPKLDDDRDRELLQDDLVPQAWKEVIRFGRGMLFTWYEKTRKVLRAEVARGSSSNKRR
ncbi:hypothetical protein BCV70DRAFT_199396 [Testicularia cyperi]|uniref:Monopolin complex subunit Csm1/Pcs1 C-terminal domain-containing protein n=1 Tax=Testicularia cyperi TaxID=1882483 RepID=A0A317XS11_9BASI|nr:hypothetical protein BCV70DRAFT_199396 [Testicularia cyperi]